MDNLDNKSPLYDRPRITECQKQPWEEEERLRALSRPLLAWYEEHARILPWRENPTPYRVWISEIMLQQTRVEAVKPYFERFIAALPDTEALAGAADDTLMTLWQGLGYYNRARNLKKAAEMIQREYQGRMPSEYEELLKLPGIGSYTAGAISSIAFGRAVPAVDGNVMRVLSRILASYEDILKQSAKKRMENLLIKTMPRGCASQFNQGLMEIGAMICVPNGAPHCGQCPFELLCLAKKEGLAGEIPVKAASKKRRIEELTVCIIDNGRQIALHRREEKGLLASLYEFPNVRGVLSPEELPGAFVLKPDTVVFIERLPDQKHIFSHIEWRMRGYRIRLKGSLPEQWTAAFWNEINTIYAMPNAFAKYIDLIGADIPF